MTDRAARVWNKVTHQHNSSQLRPHLNRNTLGVTLERQQHVWHMHRLHVSTSRKMWRCKLQINQHGLIISTRLKLIIDGFAENL